MFCQPVTQLSNFLVVDGVYLTLAFQRNNKTYEIFSLSVHCLSLSSLCCFIFFKNIISQLLEYDMCHASGEAIGSWPRVESVNNLVECRINNPNKQS